MTLFFTDFDRTAISVREIEKLGRAAVDSNEVAIENLEVPDEHVVGTVGDGFYHLLDSLNPERIVVAIEAVGIGRAALERAVQYAKERVVFDRPSARTRPSRTRWRTQWPARHGRAPLHEGGVAVRHGRPCGREANAAKLMAAEAGSTLATRPLQTFGGFGYAKEFDVERSGGRSGSTRSRRCRSRWRSTTSPSTSSGCRAPT